MTTTDQPQAQGLPVPARKRILAIRTSMNEHFIERTGAIDALFLAVLAGEHLCMLGPPGAAKTAIVSAWASCVPDAVLFSRLLTRFTTEDHVCGPIKLSALQRDALERATDKHLPGAHVAVLDEVFKSNDSLLNALLGIMNEREYEGASVPLRTLLGASNEMPESETLAALWDRFLVRVTVNYIRDEDAWAEMIQGNKRYVPPHTLTLDEWDAARAEVAKIGIPATIYEEIKRVKRELFAQAIVVSDRRWKQLLGLLRVQAWLDGCSLVEAAHLHVLSFGLWQKPAEEPIVRNVLASVDLGDAGKLIKKIDEAIEAVNALPRNPKDRAGELAKVLSAVNKTAKEVAKDPLLGQMSRGAQKRVATAQNELVSLRKKLRNEMAAVFGLPNIGDPDDKDA